MNENGLRCSPFRSGVQDVRSACSWTRGTFVHLPSIPEESEWKTPGTGAAWGSVLNTANPGADDRKPMTRSEFDVVYRLMTSCAEWGLVRSPNMQAPISPPSPSGGGFHRPDPSLTAFRSTHSTIFGTAIGKSWGIRSIYVTVAHAAFSADRMFRLSENLCFANAPYARRFQSSHTINGMPFINLAAGCNSLRALQLNPPACVIAINHGRFAGWGVRK